MFGILYNQCKPGDALDVVIIYNDVELMVADRVTLRIKDIIRGTEDVYFDEKRYVRRRYVLETPVTIGRKPITLHHFDASFRLVFEYTETNEGARYTETVKFQIDGLPDMSLLNMCMYTPEFDEKIAEVNNVYDRIQLRRLSQAKRDVSYICPACIAAGIKEGCNHQLDKIPHWSGPDYVSGKKVNKLI